ncbi:MAG: ABC transporter substrate-binding protein [bacterium]|nr:ABC transporter substrate-binding protein [bacterium]
MLVKGLLYCSFLTGLLFLSCNNPKASRSPGFEQPVEDSGIKYAKRFSIVNTGEIALVYLFGHRKNHDTTAAYVLSKDTVGLRQRYKNYEIIKRPCQKIAALSSIYAAMFCELGESERVAAIDNIDYINNEEIIRKFERGQLKELAKTPVLDLEQAVTLGPDIIFTFGMGDGLQDVDRKLKLSGLPVAVSVDHLEESPLARAEWIKFFAAFVDRKKEADSIFKQVEENYLKILKLSTATRTKPSVFSETKFGDVWYMPGGKSYVARILRDAGAHYLWADNNDVGSLPLSFEQVYAKAKEADYWINLPLVKSKKELISYETRYGEFKAYKSGMLFNNTKHSNSKGYSIYWETGMIHPERILSDLSQIFHPELKSQINKDLYYYQPLK